VRWTRPLQSVLAAGDGLIDRLLCVLGAVLCSQLPEFMQQYLQRLGGHLDEARRQLDRLQELAGNSGQTLDQYVSSSQSSHEAAVVSLGRLMRDTAGRVDSLSSAESAIRDASVFGRPFVFLQHIDLSVARSTWSVFRPAVPTTVEGFVYAGIGLLLILTLYHGAVKYPIRRAMRRRAERRSSAGTGFVRAAAPAGRRPMP
jgi:Protein of unknown function (DUF2937)